MILFVLIALVYTYIAVAYTVWSENARLFDVITMGALMAVWPIALPVGYVFGEVRLRIKWRKYRGGRYLRKTFNATAIDEHLAKYGHDDKVG